jgi:NOL1/NOP2/fmu family ribosome biogenesis protein
MSALKHAKFKSLNDKKIQQQAAYLLHREDVVYLQTDKDNFSAIVASHEPDLQLLQKLLYLRKTGLSLGMPASKEWLPAHEVALSIDAAEALNCIAVNKEQALHFLKKEDMMLPDMGKGWYIVRYEGLGLGWIKALGNRFNNYLPKHWRIRMEITDADWA